VAHEQPPTIVCYTSLVMQCDFGSHTNVTNKTLCWVKHWCGL